MSVILVIWCTMIFSLKLLHIFNVYGIHVTTNNSDLNIPKKVIIVVTLYINFMFLDPTRHGVIESNQTQFQTMKGPNPMSISSPAAGTLNSLNSDWRLLYSVSFAAWQCLPKATRAGYSIYAPVVRLRRFGLWMKQLRDTT